MTVPNLTVYQAEFLAKFEKEGGDLMKLVNTQAISKGGSYEFLVSGSDGGYASRRGANGLIPTSGQSNKQVRVNLEEFVDRVELVNVDINKAQGNMEDLMYSNIISTMKRTIDRNIISTLDSATLRYNGGTATTDALTAFKNTLAGLGYNSAAERGKMVLVCSTGFYSKLLDASQFTSSDYREKRVLDGGNYIEETYEMFMGVIIAKSELITGAGTNAEQAYMFHRDAVGFVYNNGRNGSDVMNVKVGNDDKNISAYCAVSAYFGSALLQNEGVGKITFDASSYLLS